VDLVVFDTEATARVRQEALAFLMDHTEGFDEEPGEDGAEALDLSLASLTGKASKSKSKSTAAAGRADQAKALARRQRTAQQLETLTEFAAHHLGDNFERAHMLAEACLALNKQGQIFLTHLINDGNFNKGVIVSHRHCVQLASDDRTAPARNGRRDHVLAAARASLHSPAHVCALRRGVELPPRGVAGSGKPECG
jgi:hypothetical protein